MKEYGMVTGDTLRIFDRQHGSVVVDICIEGRAVISARGETEADALYALSTRLTTLAQIAQAKGDLSKRQAASGGAK